MGHRSSLQEAVDISQKTEFMLGVGPEWVHLSQNGKVTNSFSGELAGDFMFWPTGGHRFGWFLEPAYDYSFAGGHGNPWV
jgi:hypothetical protein